MKRLIRKASLDVGQFIDQWIKRPNTCLQLRDTIIYMMNENMDCVYQGNCKNKIAFRLGRQDAADFKEEFEPLGFSDLTNCPDYHFYGKILLPYGSVSDPFFGEAPPVVKKIRNYDDFIRKYQSGKFTVDEIENELEERIVAARVMKQLMSF